MYLVNNIIKGGVVGKVIFCVTHSSIISHVPLGTVFANPVTIYNRIKDDPRISRDL